MSGDGTVALELGALPPVPIDTCANCANLAPVGTFCGVCGAHLHYSDDRRAATRPHAYSAFPEESVFHPSITTSLFPHLSHRSSFPFRAALGALALLLVAFALAGLEPAVIATSALGVPLLFALYLREVDVYGENPLVLGGVTLVVGAALGVGWALLGGPVVAAALQPTLGSILTGGKALEASVVVPAIGQALMCVPVLLLFAGRRRSDEALDGFALGAGGALGFTVAAVLANLVGKLSDAVLSGSSFTTLVTEALLRGVSQPIVAAGATGLLGAAIWAHRDDRPGQTARWTTSPLLVFVLALLFQVGLGFADQARLADLVLLAVHLGATLLVMLALRIGLHLILLSESHDIAVGPARICPHCHHVTPQMAFCPECGVATAATARPNRLDLPTTFRHDPRPESGEPAGPAPWPTVEAGSSAAATWIGYPRVAPVRSPSERRARHRVVLSTFVAGLAVIVGVLVVVAVLERPSNKPLHRCHLLCPGISFAAQGPTPFRPSGFYSGAQFSVLVPALPGIYPSPTVSKGGSLLSVTYGGAQPIEVPYNGKQVRVQLNGGTIQFASVATGALTAQQLVDQSVAKIAPNAVLEYEIPNAFVGYQLGYGAVYDVQPNSTNGNGVDDRLLLMAAVRNGIGVVVLADGPFDRNFAQDPLLNHPAFVGLDIALFLDSSVNSVTWPATSLP